MWLKYLVCKYEDQNLDVPCSSKRPGRGFMPIIPALTGSGKRGLGPCWSAILTELMSSQFSERPCN